VPSATPNGIWNEIEGATSFVIRSPKEPVLLESTRTGEETVGIKIISQAKRDSTQKKGELKQLKQRNSVRKQNTAL
jgi:hypothetical protein